jgi:hypothetical protein
MMTSSPWTQFTGVATLCWAVNCSESMTRSTSSKLRPVVIGCQQGVLPVFAAAQGDVYLRYRTGFAQCGRSIVDERSLFGGCVGEVVFLGVDMALEGFDFFVAGPGVAFGPFSGPVECVDPRTDRLEVEQAAFRADRTGRC